MIKLSIYTAFTLKSCNLYNFISKLSKEKLSWQLMGRSGDKKQIYEASHYLLICFYP